MRTRERLARMARIDEERFVARFSWPGLVGIVLDLAWLGAAEHLADDSMPTGVLAAMGMFLLMFLHPLAILCIVLALFRRGRARWLVILPNGAFLLTSVFVFVLGPGIP